MYIVVEGEDPGFNTYVHGHALASHGEALQLLAERLSVQPLLEFLSADRNAFAGTAVDWYQAPEWTKRLPPPTWCEAEDGLRTVRAMINFFILAPDAFGDQTQNVVCELTEYETVLRKTSQRGLRWFIAVSWR